MNCVLTFPKPPVLDMSTNIPGSSLDAQRIRSRIEQDCMFLLRMENTQGVKVDKVYALPDKPRDCPDWKFAITTPAQLKKEKGLLFTLKGRGLFWTIDKEKASPWVNLPEQIDKEFILASMEVDPTPHRLFCQEILHAEACEKTKSAICLEKHNPWPNNWHSQWFELLLETNFLEEKMFNLNKSNVNNVNLRFPMALNDAKNLLIRLRRGAIVSMAHRCSNELQKTQELIIKRSNTAPRDKTWKALLELCEY